MTEYKVMLEGWGYVEADTVEEAINKFYEDHGYSEIGDMVEVVEVIEIEEEPPKTI